MKKLDLTREFKSYYSAKQEPEVVEIEKANFLSITGKGDPDSVMFAKDVEALYSSAYTIKFLYKAQEKDFVVSKLEGLWWFDEKTYSGLPMTETPLAVPRDQWEYKLLIRVPDFVDKEQVSEAVESVISKKKIAAAAEVKFLEMEEGRCVQMLHIGPFSDEVRTLGIMMEYMHENKLERNGLHHEIYLSDFRKTAPPKLKTILGEPVK